MRSAAKPPVSIVMAVYNQAEFITEAIENVLRQTFKEWEFIICDDASTDDTPVILDRYKKAHPDKMVILKNERNEGVSRARNRAIGKARGEYIAFLDSDDSWDERKLERQISLVEVSPRLGLVFTGANVICDKSFDEKCRLDQAGHFNRLCGANRIAKERLLKENNICFSSIMVSKKAIEAAGYFNERLSHQVEDWIANIKIAYLFEMACIPERLTNYRLHKDSYSARFFLKEKMGWRVSWQVRRIVVAFMLKNLFKDAPSTFRERVSFIASFHCNIFREDAISLIQASPYMAKAARFLKSVLGYPKRVINRIRFFGATSLFTLFVTARCNSRCATCFYWKNIDNGGNELKLNEIAGIFAKLPRTLCVLITGGEPFLRPDIQDVIDLTINNSRIMSVSINTNGTMPERVRDIMANSLRKARQGKQYHVNVSIDGFRDTHNRIRGLDCYDSAMATITYLSELRRDFKNLHISVITVISKDNIEEIENLASFMLNTAKLDFHYFEIIRGEPRSKESLILDKKRVKDIYEHILPIQFTYFKKQSLRKINNEIERLARMYRLQFENFFEGKGWDVRCLAGKKVFVVYENGKFSLCEDRQPILDLKDYAFDMKKVLKSKAVQEEIGKTVSDKCFCTHGCYISNSMPPA